MNEESETSAGPERRRARWTPWARQGPTTGRGHALAAAACTCRPAQAARAVLQGVREAEGACDGPHANQG